MTCLLMALKAYQYRIINFITQFVCSSCWDHLGICVFFKATLGRVLSVNQSESKSNAPCYLGLCAAIAFGFEVSSLDHSDVLFTLD